MSLWIKICGNTSLEDALLAAEAGADALGFVFAPSPRRVTASQVAAIVPHLSAAVETIGVFVDAALDVRRSRFSSLHEIAHYVLPDHQGQIIVCGERDLGFRAVRVEEREANAFAAELQFKGRRFKLETASLPISALTVKETARAFDASFESTARHLVETSLKPCLLAVYANNGLDSDGTLLSSVRYSVPSPSFEQRFGRRLTDENNAHVAAVWIPGRDIADAIAEEVAIETADGETTRFRAEYFFNGYSAFCLITTPRP